MSSLFLAALLLATLALAIDLQGQVAGASW